MSVDDVAEFFHNDERLDKVGVVVEQIFHNNECIDKVDVSVLSASCILEEIYTLAREATLSKTFLPPL